MRIKEVEKRTGLTAKAIRLYESKGMLTVARKSENDYRDYTDEDVRRLKTIAVLRRLDVSLADIKGWTDGERTIVAILDEVSYQCNETDRENKLRREMAEELAEALERNPDKEIPELMDEAAELQQMMQELEDALEDQKRDLSGPVWTTMISLGPIGMTLIYMLTGGTADQMILGFALSLIAIVATAFSWGSYLRVPAKERKRSGCLLRLLWAVISIAAILGVFYGVSQVQINLFVPDEKMILLFRKPWMYGLLGMLLEFVAGYYLLTSKIKLQKKTVLASSCAALLINGILLYGCITGVSVASDTEITRHGFFTPQGIEYRYEDIESVETGFGGKILGIPTKWTGEFYYRITYRDGTTEDWGECSSDWDEDSWLWMIRLDEKVMAAGAKKTSSAEFSEYCMMEQRYVDMLLEVIHNK